MPLLGGHLTKGQPDPKADQMSSWPDVVPLLATRCLYQGVCLRSGQLDATKHHSWPWDASTGGSIWHMCKKDIWKFEHTLGFGSCITEAFSMKDQQGKARTEMVAWIKGIKLLTPCSAYFPTTMAGHFYFHAATMFNIENIGLIMRHQYKSQDTNINEHSIHNLSSTWAVLD